MRYIVIIVMGIFLLLGNSPAFGDATIESMVKIGGFKGMGASEGTVIKRYQGDKRSESTAHKFTGAILSKMTGGSEALNIIRLDKGVYWNLDPKNKTYTEKTIEPLKMGEPKEQAPKEKPKTRVTKSEFTVKKTGASENINGFPCEEYLVSWLLEMEDIETKAKTRTTMNTNLWTTPETSTIQNAQAQELQFGKAYAHKLGIDHSLEETKRLGIEALGAMSGVSEEEMGKGFKRLKEEMSKIKGYPIRSVVNWAMEGDKPAAGAKEEAPSSGSVADIQKSVGSFLGGLAGKVAQKTGSDKSSSTAGKEEAFFSSMTEIKAIHVNSISADVFEIPAGYAKK
jgi:hypothetical protein